MTVGNLVRMTTRFTIVTAALVLAGICPGQAAADLGSIAQFDIQPQPLPAALLKYAQQSGVQVTSPTEIVSGKTTQGVVGAFPADAALGRLLDGTTLSYKKIGSNTVSIVAPRAREPASTAAAESTPPLRLAQSADTEAGKEGEESTTPPERAADQPTVKGIPEILIKGARSLNLDIERTRDDAQPYVVFDRAAIERSGSQSIQEFFERKLTSNTAVTQTAMQSSTGNSGSLINLRGLGRQQTLILIDGHRIASQNSGGAVNQPDINGIPLSAIERIEVLPTTSAGIYGGSATGGVVNVILRHDYSGIEGQVAYGGTIDGGADQRRIDLTGGSTFNDGKTNFMLSASYFDQDPLLQGDRDFLENGRANLRVSASLYNALGSPPLGATTNIKSVDGAPLVLKPAYGGGAVGKSFTFVPAGYDGPASDSGAALIANGGQYNLHAASTAQAAGNRRAIYNGPTIKSVRGTLRHDLTQDLQAFLDVSHSRNVGTTVANDISGSFMLSRTAPGNPFDQNVFVTTPLMGADGESVTESRDTRAVGGVILRFAQDWSAEFDYTWDRYVSSSVNAPRTLTAAATAQVTSGVFNLFRDTNEFPVDFSPYLGFTALTEPAHTTLRGMAVRVAGALPWSLPGGTPSLSTLIERRTEDLNDYVTLSSATQGSLQYSRSQEVTSAYVEATLPFVSARNAHVGIRAADLVLSARRDAYDLRAANNVSIVPGMPPANPAERSDRDFSSVDYTAAFRYQPLESLTLRASYGTGFTPPSLANLVPSPPELLDLGARDYTDPRRGNELMGVVEFAFGGNPDLRPEESQSTSLGLIFVPPALPGLRTSVDWVRIDKRDNVTVIAFDPTTLAIEDNLPAGTIGRGPPSGGFAVGPIVKFNGTP